MSVIQKVAELICRTESEAPFGRPRYYILISENPADYFGEDGDYHNGEERVWLVTT
jgi:hypothetical protein